MIESMVKDDKLQCPTCGKTDAKNFCLVRKGTEEVFPDARLLPEGSIAVDTSSEEGEAQYWLRCQGCGKECIWLGEINFE